MAYSSWQKQNKLGHSQSMFKICMHAYLLIPSFFEIFKWNMRADEHFAFIFDCHTVIILSGSLLLRRMFLSSFSTISFFVFRICWCARVHRESSLAVNCLASFIWKFEILIRASIIMFSNYANKSFQYGPVCYVSAMHRVNEYVETDNYVRLRCYSTFNFLFPLRIFQLSSYIVRWFNIHCALHALYSSSIHISIHLYYHDYLIQSLCFLIVQCARCRKWQQ